MTTTTLTRRPNPEAALDYVIRATDRDDAIRRMAHQLGRAWAAGHSRGWDDGAADATHDDPRPATPNPYPSPGCAGPSHRDGREGRRDDG